MDNTIQALRNLYVALGGNVADVEGKVIIPDMVNALAELVAGIKQFPAVDAEDNGKIMKVVEGEWALADDATAAAAANTDT